MSRHTTRDLVLGTVGLALAGILATAIAPALQAAYRDYTVGSMLLNDETGEVYLPLINRSEHRLRMAAEAEAAFESGEVPIVVPTLP